MDKNSAISLLNEVFGVVQEHEAKMELYKYYQNMILKEELPGSVGAQYTTGDQWRSMNSEDHVS